MSELLRNQLKWFLRNLNLLLEDYELKDQGVEVDLYFDTLDVKHMVLGLQSFYYAGDFDIQKIVAAFQTEEGRPLRDRMLVICLAFSGQLGQINMLPPHQSEFLDQLNKQFRLDGNLRPKQMIHQFLRAVSRVDKIKSEVEALRKISSGEGDTDEEALQHTRKHVGKHAASAMNFYKIVQLIRGVTWKERLLKLQNEVLKFSHYNIDYDEIVRSKAFERLHQSFKAKREVHWRSNFADAVALTTLINRVEEINKHEQGPIPRFFVASNEPGTRPLFVEVLESTGLNEALKYRIPGQQGQQSDVIRTADYFVFKSTFQPSHTADDFKDKGEFTSPVELYELRGKISKILEPPSLLTAKSLDEIVVSGKRLKQILEELNTLLFFKNVWLPSANHDVELVVEDLKRAADELKSEVLEHSVNERIQEFKDSLSENAREYENIKLIWRRIEEAAKFLEKRWGDRIPFRMDYLRDFGLLRFSFPESANQRIQDVLDDLLTGTDEDERSTYINIVASCYSAQFKTPERPVSEVQMNDLVAAATVLWVARMYEQLADLLSAISPLPHYSLELIYTASLVEIHKEDEKAAQMLDVLEARHQQTEDVKEKAELAIGLAYSKFHLWKKLGYGPVWDRTDNQYKDDAAGRELINGAIVLALEAWKSVGEWDKKKEIYALNQYLYYLVMDGNESRIQEIHSAAGALLSKRRLDITEVWQHRFDDTLSHYHHRLALLELTENGWKKEMETAEYYAKEASTKAPWDKETITNLHLLQNQLKQGFKK
jgi:hypothetical protein